MNQDIDIVNENQKFKYRVSGILIKNNKLLTCRIDNNKFYCLPGGHVELMEDTYHAVEREFKEETGIDTKVVKLLFITENFFKSGTKDCHELGFYYLLDTIDDIEVKDFNIVEEDKRGLVNLAFKWIDINNLENVKPEFLKSELDIKSNLVKHLVIKNDEIKNRP